MLELRIGGSHGMEDVVLHTLGVGLHRPVLFIPDVEQGRGRANGRIQHNNLGLRNDPTIDNLPPSPNLRLKMIKFCFYNFILIRNKNVAFLLQLQHSLRFGTFLFRHFAVTGLTLL